MAGGKLRAWKRIWVEFRTYFALFFGTFAALFGLIHLRELVVARVGDVIGLAFWGLLAAASLRHAWHLRPASTWHRNAHRVAVRLARL